MATKKYLDLTGLTKYDELLKAKVAADIKGASDALSAEIAKRVILDKGTDTDTVALTVDANGKLTAAVKGNVVVDAEYATVKTNATNSAAAWTKFLAGSTDVSPVLADLATKKYADDAADAAKAAAIAAAATDATSKADAAQAAAIAAAATDATSKADAAKAAAIAAAATDATNKADDAKAAAIAAAATDATTKANAAQAAAEATAAADATTKANAAQAAAEATAAADATTKANAAEAAAKKHSDDTLAATKTELEGKIGDEATARANADSELSGRIASIETLIAAGEDDSDDVINKVSEVINFFNGVKEDEVYTNLVAKVAANETAISDEASARAAADTALGGRIDAEASAREAADTALGGRIDAEASAREAADTELDGKITKLNTDLSKAISDGDAATLTSAKAYSDANLGTAKAYTDEKIAEFVRIEESEIKLLFGITE